MFIRYSSSYLNSYHFVIVVTVVVLISVFAVVVFIVAVVDVVVIVVALRSKATQPLTLNTASGQLHTRGIITDPV